MTPTHMRREIEEIPEAVARLLDGGEAVLAAAGRDIRERDPRFVVTVARGSSDHAASFMKYAVELTAGLPVASVGPSVTSIYGVRLKLAGSACLAISQSGKSPDIVAMAEEARRGGALTIAITNTPDSPLTHGADHAIDILAGAERSVAATKTFVNSAVAGLALMAHATADEALLSALRQLPEHFRAAIGCDWMKIAAALDGTNSLFIIGRGPSMAIANEAALKLKETCAMHAESYSAAEVMHGPLALVKPGFPVLALAARDRSEPSMAEAADHLVGKGATVFTTTALARAAAPLPFASTGHPMTDPLALVVSFYAFVEAFARHRGLNPDQPPNLRKVTETL
ncbi:glucosamine--fructose-6-phosphate aminotransferase [Mesorhizobium sp. L-8-10]|uniref:SIS domain-containing protein n=1 Tax=Mesorhizobium sp. L-8-10 TaxID=2744523 RepID=UPI001936F932|nr:SIS domain-containing protein [Mesorhizobium sp. L-8-10]BCH28743.1 glucosamine--fructose-6-phosphate aminotransferase [Mesorhizobium sp. L-8-10]